MDDADGYKVQWRSAGQTFGSARERVAGGSVTQDTIPNLTPGTQYFVRVIATGTGTDDGTPSNAESGTPLAAVNQPPETTSQIAMQFLEVGGSVRIGLSNHFRDPEGRTMTFSAVSDNTRTATASVQGSVLTIRGVARGRGVRNRDGARRRRPDRHAKLRRDGRPGGFLRDHLRIRTGGRNGSPDGPPQPRIQRIHIPRIRLRQ